MKYIDSYNKIKELKEELRALRVMRYDYEAIRTPKEQEVIDEKIKAVISKIKFIENMRKANEKLNQGNSEGYKQGS